MIYQINLKLQNWLMHIHHWIVLCKSHAGNLHIKYYHEVHALAFALCILRFVCYLHISLTDSEIYATIDITIHRILKYLKSKSFCIWINVQKSIICTQIVGPLLFHHQCCGSCEKRDDVNR